VQYLRFYSILPSSSIVVFVAVSNWVCTDMGPFSNDQASNNFQNGICLSVHLQCLCNNP
jgi:hypothetical protein